MYNHIRRNLGVFKRGLTGVYHTYFQSAPSIPVHLKPIQMGVSNIGRPIYAYQIGEGTTPVLMLSAIHGNEVGTIKLAHHLMRWLDVHSGAGNFSEMTFYVIPCLNVDGYAEAKANPNFLNDGRVGRFNGRKVDLNRNFPVESHEPYNSWTHGKDYEERTDVFCGEYGGSEPEIKALVKFIEDMEIKVVYSFHNAGRDVMPSSTEVAKKLSQKFAEVSNFRHIPALHWSELKQTGTMAEWCEDRGLHYVEVEGSTRWGSDWSVQKDAISSTLKLLESCL